MTLDENSMVRLIDFGHSETVTLMTKQEKGTPRYKAMEVCSGEEYSVEKADIYSLGATLFTVMFLSFPDLSSISGKEDQAAFKALFGKGYSSFRRSHERHPTDALHMLWACFAEDPNERPSISKFYEIPWIADAPRQLDAALLEEI